MCIRDRFSILPTCISLDIWQTIIAPNPAFKEIQAQLFAQFFELEEISLLRNSLQILDTEAYQLADNQGIDLNFEQRIALLAQKLQAERSLSATRVADLYDNMAEAFLANPPFLLENTLLETLQGMQNKGIVLVLLSNTGFVKGITMRQFLQKSGIWAYMQAAVFSNEVGHAKPDARIFAQILRLSKAQLPEQVCHIGDNYIADYQGAKNMGMQAILWQNPKYSTTFADKVLMTPTLKALLSYL
jgi:putative hydrolase of the HAD superfamily